MRYKTYFNEKTNTFYTVSTYAGKSVVGKAKCHEKDVFNKDIAETLSKLRCDCKIAAKRLKRAKNKMQEADEEVHLALAQCRNMTDYYSDSFKEYDKVTKELNDFLKSIN